MDTEENLELLKKAQVGWFWTGGEQFIQRGLSMLVSLVLARILGPEAFGLIASVAIFINIAQQLINGGISQRVIQKKNAIEDDYLALFWSNLVASLGATAVLAVLSFPVAAYFSEPELMPIMIGLAVVLFITNAGRVQEAKLTRQLAFKKLALIQTAATFGGCIVGLVMVFSGYGVWALIGQQLMVAGLRWIMLIIFCPWMPRRLPAFHSVRDLYSFGLPVVASQCLRSFADQAGSVMIAKNFSMVDLGFFNRGLLIPQNIGYSLQLILSRTNFPTLSRVVGDNKAVKEMYLHFLHFSGGLVGLIMTGLIASSDEVVEILLGNEWMPSVWYMQLSALMFFIYIVYVSNMDLLKALGRTKRLFLYNTISALFQIVGIGIGFYFSGIKGIVLGDIVGRLVGCLIFMGAVSRVSMITVRSQLSIIARVGAMCGVFALLILVIQASISGLYFKIIIIGFLGVVALILFWKQVASSLRYQ